MYSPPEFNLIYVFFCKVIISGVAYFRMFVAFGEEGLFQAVCRCQYWSVSVLYLCRVGGESVLA
jgi:hypothetical protein